MGTRVFTVSSGRQYIIDDKSRKVRRIIVQDDANIPQEDLQELLFSITDGIGGFDAVNFPKV